MRTLAERLQAVLSTIVATMDDLLDASTIDYVPDRMQQVAERTGVVHLSICDGRWGALDDVQRGIQRQLLELWTPWFEQIRFLFSEDTVVRQNEITNAGGRVAEWIQRTGGFQHIPPTMSEAKTIFRDMAEPLFAALRSLGTSSGQVLVVPDTNVLIRSQDITTYGAVLGESAYRVLLVPGVLGELDAHKINHKVPAVRERARKACDRIKGWRNQGDLAKGVRVQGDVWAQVEGREPDFAKTLSWLRSDVIDDQIMATILEVQRRRPTDRVILLTGDVLMLAKADAASVPTADTPDPDPEA
jgi:hypothetical protein